MAGLVITTLLDSSSKKIGIEILTNDYKSYFNNTEKIIIKCAATKGIDLVNNEDGNSFVQINYIDGLSDQLTHTLVDEIDGDTDISSTEILYQKFRNIIKQ